MIYELAMDLRLNLPVLRITSGDDDLDDYLVRTGFGNGNILNYSLETFRDLRFLHLEYLHSLFQFTINVVVPMAVSGSCNFQ